MEIRAIAARTAPDGFDRLENPDHSFHVRPEMPSYFQALDRGRPVGSLSVFLPTADTAEISACVRPSCRRQGIFRALLQEAVAVLRPAGCRRLLFPCQGDSGDDRAVAAHWGLALDHSEYLMYYGGAHAAPRVSVSLRPAQETDRSALEVLYSAAFPGNGGMAAGCLQEGILCRVLERQGRLAGAACVNLRGEALSIFGVAVDPALQGQGLGGGLMAALLDGLAPLRGKRHVLLEVDGGNERARRLYASSGFTVRRLVEYYSLPLLQAAPSGA